MEAGAEVQGRREPRAFEVLRHPLRVRIVEACTEWGALSPVEIRDRGLCADMESVRSKTPKQQLSHISYHCRRLEKAGLLTLVAEAPVRGATEHFYRANAEAYFSDEEWAALSLVERQDISRVMWQRFVAQVEIAMQEGTLDLRADRWLVWGPMAVDERGWKEMGSASAGYFAELDHIRRGAEERLKKPGSEPIRATYGMFVFPSPSRR